MRNFVFFVCYFFSATTAFSQANLSKETIKDFAAVCWFNYRAGNINFIATMNSYLPYSKSKVAQVMEELDTNTEAREEVFKLFYRVAGNYESLFNYFYGLKLTARQSQEIANYIINKYGQSSDNNILKREISKPFYLKDGKKIYVDESEIKYSLFEGTKSFVDKDKIWKYVVTIKRDSANIELYSIISVGGSPSSYKLKKKYNATIKGNRFYYKGKDLGLKYIDETFYEMNNEGFWNEYLLDITK